MKLLYMLHSLPCMQIPHDAQLLECQARAKAILFFACEQNFKVSRVFRRCVYRRGVQESSPRLKGLMIDEELKSSIMCAYNLLTKCV